MQSEGSSYKVTIFKNSEKPTGLHPLLSGIGNERVNQALACMGIDNVLTRENVLKIQNHSVLVGCGTDGAAVNVSDQNGMRGKLHASLPWWFWAWYYAHRLELASKDAFSSHLFFKDIDELLLRLYYLYEKSPQRCRELSDLMDDLKEVYKLPEEGGSRPLRAHGIVGSKLSLL